MSTKTNGARAEQGAAGGAGWLARAAKSPALWVALAGMVATWVIAKGISHQYFDNVVDDSLISMQYAKQVARGNGVVFNVGERVEGYTNFLWVMVMAALYRGCEAVGSAFMPNVINLSVFLAAVDVGLVCLIGRRLWPSGVAAFVVAASLLVLDNGYQMWAAMALESHLLALCFLSALAIAVYRPRRWPVALGVSLALAQMTRPDAGLFSVMLVGSLALKGLLKLRAAKGGERPAALAEAKELGLAIGVWVGLFGVYFAWRYHYYGYLHPNTYYLKVAGSKLDAYDRGLEYVKAFLEERAYWPAATVLAALWVRQPVVRALVAYLASHVAYQIYVGGDFYAGHRFFIGQLPLFALLMGQIAYGVETHAGPLLARVFRLAEPPPRLAASGGVLLVLVSLGREIRRIGEERGPIVEEIVRWGPERDVNRTFSFWLRDHKPKGASIATGDIGSAGFFVDADNVVDLLGVIDPVVAHRDVKNFGKGQAGHEKRATVGEILAKRPTYIKLGYLHDDFNAKGYFLDTSVPAEIDVDGIWRRDELIERGRFLPETWVRFEPGTTGWQASGKAFERFPSGGPLRGQGRVTGQAGSFVNSYHPDLGDAATGTLESPPFALVGDRMVVRVGGGHDPERLRVSLVVDGQRVFSETGRNRELLGRKEWDIAPLRGKTATIEIVDQATGRWGHIMVDEIAQWSPVP